MRTFLSTLFFIIYASIATNTIAQSKETIAQEKLLEDLTFLETKLIAVHPNIYTHFGAAEFKKRISDIAKEIDNDKTLEDFYLLIAPLVANIEDGHTNIFPVVGKNRMNYLNNGGLTLPLKLKLENGGLIVEYVMSNFESSIKPNAIITQINNTSSDEICEFLYSLIGAEKNNYIKDTYLQQYISTLLWYRYKWEGDYTFDVKSENAEAQKVQMPGITQKEALPFMQRNAPKQVPSSYSLAIDSSAHTAIMKIKSFANTSTIVPFLNEAFDKINKQNKIEELTIDVRDNGGGASASVDSLMFHLTKKPYKTYYKVDIKVSQDRKDSYKEKRPKLYNELEGLENGTIYNQPTETIQSDKDNIYTGKLKVLCNESTYSGASTFTSLVKCLNIGKVIGESGQENKYFADYLFYKLPNTQIQLIVSTKTFNDCEL